MRTFKYSNTFENLASEALKSIEIFVSTDEKKKHQTHYKAQCCLGDIIGWCQLCELWFLYLAHYILS